MEKINITGYWYRKKYDCGFITYTVDGKEYLTNGKIIKELIDRHKKTMENNEEKCNVNEIYSKLKIYHPRSRIKSYLDSIKENIE